MEEVPMLGKKLPLILGRPFLRTARTKIDVYEGTLTLAINDEIVEFKVLDALKFPNDDNACFSIEVLEQLVQETFNTSQGETPLERALIQSPKIVNEEENTAVLEAVSMLEALLCQIGKYIPNFESLPLSTDKLVPSIVKAPQVELKPLLESLKYTYLGDGETLPVIIASDLSEATEDKLVRVLREHKTALGSVLVPVPVLKVWFWSGLGLAVLTVQFQFRFDFRRFNFGSSFDSFIGFEPLVPVPVPVPTIL
ncbi:hypothetical protein LWI28_026940 [Acer negundo]|uniref:Reverse transcriptase domain-containing protein n=1 Tax=Acer negundo TaxID=4023 RepID=A0AAD5NNF2_ACENE|nr:hypothetical protein LWI28_026940 [Acer negundo]